MPDLALKFQQALSEGNANTLVEIYVQAADEKETQGDIDAACFLLTHAYVHALQSGSDSVLAINRRLVAHGREHPLTD